MSYPIRIANSWLWSTTLWQLPGKRTVRKRNRKNIDKKPGYYKKHHLTRPKKKQIKLILRVTTTKLRSTRSKLTRNSRFTRARFLNSWYFVVDTGSLNNSFPNTHEYNLIAVKHLNSPGIYALKLPTMKCDRTTQYLWRHVK